MDTIDDVHLQFAMYFRERNLTDYLYKLSEKMSEGSTCLELSEQHNEDASNTYSDLEKSKLVGNSSVLDRPFILDSGRLYQQRYFKYEVALIEKIKSLVEEGNTQFQTRTKALKTLLPHISKVFPSPYSTIDWQKTAAIFALVNNFTIITGGPGTGKTTTVAKILSLLWTLDPSQRVALAAPTGKAASRMAESLRNAAGIFDLEIQIKFASIQPSTIHRLLGSIRDSIYFKHNKDNPLKLDTIVVDESSMIDIALFSKLLEAIDSNTRIILLGDKDQLSSVEVGSLFGDLCNTVDKVNHFTQSKVNLIQNFIKIEVPVVHNPAFLQDNIIELKESHRFKATEGIGRLSNAVIENQKSVIESFFETPKYSPVIIETSAKETELQYFLKGYELYTNEKDIAMALKLLDNQRILCATKEGIMGVHAWNRKVESYLVGRNAIEPKQVFYENRPIIVTENNYELGLFNGDIGIIRIDDNDLTLKAWFLDSTGSTGVKAVLPGLIQGMETVYAMTIHKSQGSEFNEVMILLPDEQHNNHTLTREILYTGITRAKKKVVIVAEHKTILDICERRVQRSSGVEKRI